MVVGIEKGAKGISRWYGRVVETATKVNLGGFMRDHISADAEVKTDYRSGYNGMETHFPKMTREKSEKKGENFKQMHRVIMMFKAWLRGTQHSVMTLYQRIHLQVQPPQNEPRDLREFNPEYDGKASIFI